MPEKDQGLYSLGGLSWFCYEGDNDGDAIWVCEECCGPRGWASKVTGEGTSCVGAEILTNILRSNN